MTRYSGFDYSLVGQRVAGAPWLDIKPQTDFGGCLSVQHADGLISTLASPERARLPDSCATRFPSTRSGCTLPTNEPNPQEHMGEPVIILFGIAAGFGI